jgi:hypothetical protein
MVLTEIQEEWLQALESGGYPQGRYRLVDQDGYCCLGVACEILGLKRVSDFGGFWSSTRNRNAYYLPGNSWKKLGLRNNVGSLDKPVSLSAVTRKKVPTEECKCPADSNDPGECKCLADFNDHGATFKQIARYIRKHPENVFV